MTPSERGAYIHLLAICWCSSDCTIPDDDAKLRSLSGLRADDDITFLHSVFHRHPEFPGKLINNRLMEEFEKAGQKCMKQRDNAKKRWTSDAKAMPPHSDGNAVEDPSESHRHNIGDNIGEENTNNHVPASAPPTDKRIAGFEEFYRLYPLKKGRIAAEKAYRKTLASGVSHEYLMEALKSQLKELRFLAGQRTSKGSIPCKHPSTWLNSGSYYDEKAEESPDPSYEDDLEKQLLSKG